MIRKELQRDFQHHLGCGSIAAGFAIMVFNSAPNGESSMIFGVIAGLAGLSLYNVTDFVFRAARVYVLEKIKEDIEETRSADEE